MFHRGDSLGHDFYPMDNKTRSSGSRAPCGFAAPHPSLSGSRGPEPAGQGLPAPVPQALPRVGERLVPSPVPSPVLFVEHSVCLWWTAMKVAFTKGDSCFELCSFCSFFPPKTLALSASCEAGRLAGFQADALNSDDRGCEGSRPAKHRGQLSWEFSLGLQRLLKGKNYLI